MAACSLLCDLNSRSVIHHNTVKNTMTQPADSVMHIADVACDIHWLEMAVVVDAPTRSPTQNMTTLKRASQWRSGA